MYGDDIAAVATASKVLECAALEGTRFTAPAVAMALGHDVDDTIDLLEDALLDDPGHTIQADVERLRGGSADHILTGDGDANVIYGAGGDDVIDGNAGNDVLYGQAGADSIDALDGFPYRDRPICGSEIDSTSSDSWDVRDPTARRSSASE